MEAGHFPSALSACLALGFWPDGERPDLDPLSRTPLLVWRAFLKMVFILMMRVPALPSRLKPISIPTARNGVCTRRSRPASARGLLGQPVRSVELQSLPRPALARRRSAALPVHELHSAMI